MVTTLDELCWLTVTRGLFNATTLKRAIDRLGIERVTLTDVMQSSTSTRTTSSIMASSLVPSDRCRMVSAKVRSSLYAFGLSKLSIQRIPNLSVRSPKVEPQNSSLSA